LCLNVTLLMHFLLLMVSTYDHVQIRVLGLMLLVPQKSYLQCMRRRSAGLENQGESNHMKFKNKRGPRWQGMEWRCIVHTARNLATTLQGALWKGLVLRQSNCWRGRLHITNRQCWRPCVDSGISIPPTISGVMLSKLITTSVFNIVGSAQPQVHRCNANSGTNS